jgi:hypothetical protein
MKQSTSMYSWTKLAIEVISDGSVKHNQVFFF